MEFNVNHVPLEEKWAMATQGLTGALSAHLNALYGTVGKQKYTEIIRQIWSLIGQGCAAQVREMGMAAGSARSVAEAGTTVCMCAMGPEYKIEEIESRDDRTVMKITHCPWNNRMKEFGISDDLLTACDSAFWDAFVQALNPDVSMRHGKQMHCGDAHCEWIFEHKKASAP